MWHLFLLGQFTLRDMYEQFQNIMKMGPFGQIMVMPTLTERMSNYDYPLSSSLLTISVFLCL